LIEDENFSELHPDAAAADDGRAPNEAILWRSKSPKPLRSGALRLIVNGVIRPAQSSRAPDLIGYTICVLKATKSAGPAAEHVDHFEEVLQIVARSITQVRLHERLLRSAGVRLDRAGAALLSKLSTGGDSLRVTDLAELLGVDAPTVTRKVQQLERDGMVVRQADPDDRRATRIRLTSTGRRTLERVRRSRRAWLDQLLEGWNDEELSTLADLLGRFADDLEHDSEGARV
jgi:DNA-binding MarR family transcriptional regulator